MKKFILLFCFATLVDGGDILRQRCALVYDFHSWRGKSEVYIRTLESWQLPCINVNTNGIDVYVKSDFVREENIMRYLFFDESKQDVILRIDVNICKDILAAHDAIIDDFSNMASTRRFKKITDMGIGDHLFYSSFGNGCDSCVFARNNLKVSIYSRCRSSALDIARQIDADVLNASKRETRFEESRKTREKKRNKK